MKDEIETILECWKGILVGTLALAPVWIPLVLLIYLAGIRP